MNKLWHTYVVVTKYRNSLQDNIKFHPRASVKYQIVKNFHQSNFSLLNIVKMINLHVLF